MACAWSRPPSASSLPTAEVEQRGSSMIVVDSLNGYMAAMPQKQQLILQIHELLSYLSQLGVVTFLINPQHGLVGSMSTNFNVSYVADTVILIRFFEAQGRLRKAISVLKHRGGAHEDAIRELRVDSRGVRIGEPLSNFRGVLTGTPEYFGADVPLMEGRKLPRMVEYQLSEMGRQLLPVLIATRRFSVSHPS
nr:ATPase domain-containing protein [Pseudomonas sp. MWU16-30317]